MHFARACGFPGSELPQLSSDMVYSDEDCADVSEEDGTVVVSGGGVCCGPVVGAAKTVLM